MYELKALTQAIWEDQYSKKEVRTRLRKMLEENDELMDEINAASSAVINYYINGCLTFWDSKADRWDTLIALNQTIEICLDMFVLVTQNQYCNIQTIVGQMVNVFEGKLNTIDSVKTLSEVCAVIASETDLWDIQLPEDSELGVITVIANYEFQEEIKQYLANIKYLPPMLVRPKMVNSNYDYDYFNTQSSKILGSGNHHDDPISLDVINICNGTKLKLDTFMLQFDENPNKELDTVEKVEQFNRMASASKRVYQEILDQGNEFYLTHKYDKRGRLYSQGYHINIQSTDYKKSLISLAEGELLDNF
ncbi:MAG: hypothetical protein ACKO8L_12250 [Flavobacterium sp.]